MAESIRKFLRLAPTPVEGEENAFSPSPLSLWLGVDKQAEYTEFEYPSATKEMAKQKTILVVCTEERFMTMEDGKTKFSTGNHPVETIIPLKHFLHAGFNLQMCTPTGKPAVLEEWAMPTHDDAFLQLYKSLQSQFQSPLSLEEVVATLMDDSPYAAVFLPGGHGAMLGLPQNSNLARLLSWAMETNKFVMALCHGPAALLAADQGALFKGYKLTAFPDSMDKVAPYIGYLPGTLPWYMGQKLTAAGMTIINKSANGAVHKDRNLITGDSPKAANAFGKLATDSLVNSLGLDS